MEDELFEDDTRLSTALNDCEDVARGAEVSDELELDEDSSEAGDGSDEEEPPRAGASSSAAALVVARAKPAAKQKVKQNELQCKGCFISMKKEEMYPSTNLCKPCKKAYDGLSKLSRKQGREEWWARTRSQPKDLKKVLAKFKNVCPDLNVGRGKKRAATVSIARYTEWIEAAPR
eukprot:65764-Amphidinium_carterae.1